MKETSKVLSKKELKRLKRILERKIKETDKLLRSKYRIQRELNAINNYKNITLIDDLHMKHHRYTQELGNILFLLGK